MQGGDLRDWLKKVITLDAKATMHCTEKACKASVPVQLCLTAGGGFSPKVPDAVMKSWQIILNRDGQLAAFCPNHQRKVETQSVIRSVQ